MREWETRLLRFMSTNYPNIGASINAEKTLTGDNEKALRAALEEFNQTFS
jgi:F0F1-type ATP synthase alpha subunit